MFLVLVIELRDQAALVGILYLYSSSLKVETQKAMDKKSSRENDFC